MPFDVQGARAAGYSDAEIADELAKGSNFDVGGARAGGYSDAEIIAELGAGEPAAPSAPAQQPVDSPERRALVEQLRQRIGAADQAGSDLAREEAIYGVARPLLQGFTVPADAVAGLPRLATNLSILGANKLFGTDIPGVQPLTSGRLAPQTTGERYTAAATGGLAGALTGVGVGQQLAQTAGPVASRVGAVLAANPVIQGAGGVTGGLSGEGAKDAGAGPVLQTLASIGGSMVPSAAVSAATKVATGVNRTAEAQRLLDRGVDLTPGQLNPKGLQSQVEESLQSVGGVGPPIANARQNARATFQRAAIQEGAAPGTTISQAEPAAMLDEAYQSFTPLYDAAKGFPASAQIVNTTGNVSLSSALSRAVRDKSILATNDQRKTVLGYLKDQLTKGVRSSDDLLNIRSSIRDKQRAAANATGKEEQAELLAAADDVITKALDSQLPPDALRSLRTADAKYADYKVVERAVARSKDRADGFTPNDLSESIAQASRGSNAGSYARGGGGALRELAADGRRVLDSRSPPTGARLLTLAAPAAGLSAIDPATGAAVAGAGALGSLAAATTQTGRRLAAGTTAPQQALLRQIQSRGGGLPLSYLQTGVGGALNAASQQLTPTAQVIRDMVGIPAQPPQSLALQSPEDQLRRRTLLELQR